MSDMKVGGASGTGYIPAPGAAQVAAVPDNSLNDLLLTVVYWTGAGTIPPGGINLHAPLLDSPGMSPEDQIAVLARLDIGVNMERLNLTKSDLRRLLDVQLQANQQQKE
ncbi:MAG: hypothetical protein JWQ23_1478, partial [Herminiimonas sp.]|nr:hypothetical protein [Herminiimonas sp.]